MATGGNVSESPSDNTFPEIGQRRSTDTPFGLRRTIAGLECAEKTFLLHGCFIILIAIILFLCQFISVIITGNAASGDFSFSLLLVVNGGFAAFYMVHGFLREKKFELFAFVLTTLLVLVYCIVDLVINVEGRNAFKWVRLCFAIYFFLSNFVFALVAYRRFGYLSVISAGAHKWKQDLHKMASSFFSALIFDAQIAVSFMILVLKDGTDVDWIQAVALFLGIPYSIAWYYFAHYVVKRQEKRCVKWFIGAGVIKLLFFIAFLTYKLSKISCPNPETDTERVESGYVIEKSRIVAGFFGIISWIIIVVVLCFLARHFGQGLGAELFGLSTETSRIVPEQNSYN